MAILERALRMGESKQFKQYEKRVARINGYEPELELESIEELRARMEDLRESARAGESIDDLLPETFAIVREVGKRTMGMRHFDVQLIGGMVLHGGSIADSQVAEVTLYLKGVTLRAEGASREMSHAVRVCSEELSRQVKRHRDKRRKRRKARAQPPQPAL